MDFGITGIVGITVIAYLIGAACKVIDRIDDKYIPVICGLVGMCLGIAGLKIMPDFPAKDFINAAAIGIVSGLAATGVNQVGKQLIDG